MVISERYKYCFIEYPRSASYAIRKELIRYYGGEDYLTKHGKLNDFKNSKPKTYGDYFIFCSIRSPLRDLISVYNINKHNSSGRAESKFWKNYKWFIRYRELRRSKFFRLSEDISFPNFFDQLFHLPYIKPRIIAELSHENYNYIIKVESLQKDFSAALRMLGIPQVREVPFYNVSTKRERDINTYYPPHLRQKVVRVLGPIMEFMGYNFPPSWNVTSIPLTSRIYFEFVKHLASFFWEHVNYTKKNA
jgi:hypothetical protein